MRFQIGQKVRVKPANVTGVVTKFQHFIFGTFYVVTTDDGQVIDKLGWNNLEAI